MRVVLDTNILLVIASPKSPYHWVYEALEQSEYTICFSNEILLEYEEIIGEHMGGKAANNVIKALKMLPNAVYVTPFFKWSLIPNDADDNKFVDCALTCNAQYLVSEDKHFRVLKNLKFPPIDLISFQEFQDILQNK